MALFKMLRGNEIHLPTSIVDGQVYFCKDTKNIYIDCGDARYRIAAQYADKLRYYADGNIVEIDPGVILTDSNYATKIGTASDSKDGLMSAVDKKKLDNIADGAQVNKIEGITLGGNAVVISNKTVDVPMATLERLGLVKSSEAENKITVGEDGTMEVNSININKIVQTDGDLLIINGGAYNT